MAAHPYWGLSLSAQPMCHTVLFLPLTMDPKSQKQKRQDNTLSSLDAAIDAMNLAKEVSGATPAKAVFGTVSIILTMIRVRFPLPSDGLFQFFTLLGLDGEQI